MAAHILCPVRNKSYYCSSENISSFLFAEFITVLSMRVCLGHQTPHDTHIHLRLLIDRNTCKTLWTFTFGSTGTVATLERWPLADGSNDCTIFITLNAYMLQY